MIEGVSRGISVLIPDYGTSRFGEESGFVFLTQLITLCSC